MDLFVCREQLTKVTHFVQSLLVMGHSSFHQQARDPILHLHHLAFEQMPIAQCAAAVSNLC